MHNEYTEVLPVLLKARPATVILCLTLLALSLSPVVSATGSDHAESPRRVFVSIPPQAFIVEALIGDGAEIEVLLAPGHSPATFEPTPKLVARLSESDLYFTIGVPFESNLKKKFANMLNELTFVEMQQGVTLRRMEPHGESDHTHGAGCTTDGNDPHIWLSPQLMIDQAKTTANALCETYPELTSRIEARHRALVATLSELDQELSAILAPHRGRTLLVFHPAFGYFADRYGLKQLAVESEGKEPSIRQLVDLIDRVRKESSDGYPPALFVQA
jgi:zinc transport system substrate-binding protein